ncbi:MAG: RQC domain-containing protein, partial [Thermoguttaceae bacterium]
GIKSIIDILIGASTERIRQMGHDKLPTWGVGKDKDKRYWRQLINAIIHKGFALMNPRSEFPIPQITERGWEVLRGHEKVELIRFPQRRTSSKQEKIDVDISANDHTLFERLRKLRSEIAHHRGVPPYVVFTDKSLLDMVRIKPQNREEFLMVNGVGEAKATAFCDIFLSALWEDIRQDN